MKRRIVFAVVATVGLAAWCQALVAEELRLSNKWRVEVDNSADSDGTIVFRVTPKGGQPTDISVAIKNGRGENDVAKDIRDAFRSALDAKKFASEIDDADRHRERIASARAVTGRFTSTWERPF